MNSTFHIFSFFLPLFLVHQVNISETEFFNSHSIGNGGAVSALGSHLIVQNTRFHGCSSGGSGGALHVSSASSQQFDSVTGLLQEETFRSQILIQGCWFVNCSCALQGAGVSLEGATASILSSEFEGCMSGGYGGGLASGDSKSTLQNVIFRRNVAADGGGGLYFSSSAISPNHVPEFLDYSSESELCGDGRNVADYGSCLASSPWKLQVRRSAATDFEDRQRSVGQPEMEIRFLAQMLDFYGNHLVTDSTSQILVKTPASSRNMTVLAKTETMNRGSIELVVQAWYNFENITSADWEMASSALHPEGAVFNAPALSQRIDFFAIPKGGGETISTHHELAMAGGSGVCPAGQVFYISADLQGGCKACPEGKYSINPVFSQRGQIHGFRSDVLVFDSLCLPCPSGAKCAGGTSFEPNTPQSVWEENGYVWKLRACPRGYRKMVCSPATALAQDDTSCPWDHAWQRCEQCAAGKFILNSSDHTSICRDCPTNAKCQVPSSGRIVEPIPSLFSFFRFLVPGLRCPCLAFRVLSGVS